MTASISVQGNTILVIGVLDYQTGKNLHLQGKQAIFNVPSTTLILDLSKVTHSSSVGIALLLAWLRCAKQCHKTLTIINLPSYMEQIATVSNVLQFLMAKN